MARSKPDGYTLMVGNVSTNAITPVLFKSKFQIDFEKNVVSVSRLAIYPSFLITTTANFDMKSVKDLVDYAKKNPGQGPLHQRRRRLASRISTWRCSRGGPASTWCTSRTRPAPPA